MNLVLTSHSKQGWLRSPRVPIDVGLPGGGGGQRVAISIHLRWHRTHPCQGLGFGAQPHVFCCGSSSCSPPQVVRSLKKAMAPVLSDVSVEWVFPESTEALVSPLSSSCLFPGDRLVGYSIICDTSLYISKPRAVSATLLPLSLPAWLRSPWHRCAKPNAGTALLSPGQEAAVQHHALPGVGQLRFLSFPRRGDMC